MWRIRRSTALAREALPRGSNAYIAIAVDPLIRRAAVNPRREEVRTLRRAQTPVSKALGKILDLDASLLVQIRRLERRWLTPAMQLATRLGNAEVWFALGFTLIAAGVEARVAGLRLGAAAVLGTAFAQIVKRLCKRQRPNLRIRGFIALSENPDHFSLPSGHTTTAWAVAIALLGQGLGLGELAVGFALVISLSRVYLGAHYPLDVGAGAVIGAGAGLLVRFIFSLLAPV